MSLDGITHIDGKPINSDGSWATSYEQVDHPKHYQMPGGFEVIDIVEHMSFNIGNAIKYLCRAGLKPGTDTLTDLRKSIWYVQREILRLQRQQGEQHDTATESRDAVVSEARPGNDPTRSSSMSGWEEAGSALRVPCAPLCPCRACYAARSNAEKGRTNPASQ